MDVTNSMLGLMGVPSWQRGSSNNIMGPSLSSLISVMQLGKVAYEFEHSLFAAASCTFCKASFMFMQYYLDRGLSPEEVKEDRSGEAEEVGFAFAQIGFRVIQNPFELGGVSPAGDPRAPSLRRAPPRTPSGRPRLEAAPGRRWSLRSW